MKKTALFMTFIMICLCFHFVPAVSANQDNVPDIAMQDGLLYHMGITEGPFNGQTSLTRGEFALWISRLAGLDEALYNDTEHFADVPLSNKYSGAVGAVYGLGIMNGTGKNEFGIKQNIEPVDAMVALIRLLGFDVAAKAEGGYPGGYIKRASRLGIDKGIEAAGDNVYAQILIMCFNALDVNYLDVYGNVVNSTLLEDVHGMYESDGIINANMYTGLVSSEENVKSNEIRIGNEIYITDNAGIADSIGEYVDFWYRESDSGMKKSLVYAHSDEGKNERLIISAEDIVSAENNTVEYFNEKDRTEKVKLTPGFSFLLNNVTVDFRTTENLKIDDGEIVLIDNNSDGVYDTVKAKCAETMVFQGVDETEDIIYCREGNIKTDAFDKEHYAVYYIIDEIDGTCSEISIDEIPSDSVLTIYRSENGRYLEIYASTAVVYGVIQSIGDEDITVDEVVYEFPLKTPVDELHVGAEATFSTDMFGRLVYLEDEKYIGEPVYGYLFDYAMTEKMDGNSQIKVVHGDTNKVLDLDEDVCVDDMYTYSHDELINCSALFENGEPVRQLIRYRLNSDKLVTDIYTTSGSSEYSIKQAADINKNAETSYYQWYKIYAGKYILPDNNYFLVVPTVDDEPSDIELYSTSYYFGDDISSCYCEVYDVNDDMEAGAVIIYAQDPLKGKATTTANSSVGIIQKLTKGDDYNYVYLYNGSEIVKYKLDKENNPDIKMYGFGDVVRYVIGKENVITTLDMVLDIGSTGENTPAPVYYQDGYDYHHFSRVYKKLDTHYVLVPNYNNPTYDDSIANRIVAPSSFSRCAVIDMSQKKIITGTYSSMAQYFKEEGYGACYAYTRLYKWNTAKELFIYKF